MLDFLLSLKIWEVFILLIRWGSTNYKRLGVINCKSLKLFVLWNCTICYHFLTKIYFYYFFRYAVDPGPVVTGLGVHILPGLGFCGSMAALCCWLPWLRSAENGCQTSVYCATDSSLAEQSGLYYSDCSVHLTSERGANMDDAYRLWEMSERMAGQWIMDSIVTKGHIHQS